MSPRSPLSSDEEAQLECGDDASSDDGSSSFTASHRIFPFRDVWREEMRELNALNFARPADGQRRRPFSLAFSGGGIRAAAFQAGVLWRLAQEDRLKDVEYLAAVSGGGYIAAAFASHCLAAPAPRHGGAREWYLDVVARTICRMQENAGDFVRDCVKRPGMPIYGGGYLPRALDTFVLLGHLVLALAINPLMLVIWFIVPLTICIEFCFGGAYRAAFCAADTMEDDRVQWFAIFYYYSSVSGLADCLQWMVTLAFVVFLLSMCIPACKMRRSTSGTRPTVNRGYLVGYAARAFLQRGVLGLIVLLVFLIMVPLIQIGTYNPQLRSQKCAEYMYRKLHESVSPKCSDLTSHGTPWYNDTSFKNWTVYGTQSAKGVLLDAYAAAEELHEYALPPRVDEALGLVEGMQRAQANAFTIFFAALTSFFTVALCVIPIVGPKPFLLVLSFSGPVFGVVINVSFVQYAVYGPVTGNEQGSYFDRYSKEYWNWFVQCSLIAAIVLVPVHLELRGAFHRYYRRCLQFNYFHDGRDIKFADLKNCAHCPLVLLTGTLTDYQPPGETGSICEMSFSPLHFGCEGTGYVKMPRYRTLAKCAAISGAGCLDAITLSMSRSILMRFWLEMLNLSWGDYVIFEHYDKLTWSSGPKKEQITRQLHRLPSMLVQFVVYLALNVLWYYETSSPKRERSCDNALVAFRCATWIVGIALALSFFTFVPYLDLLTLSPAIRAFHQLTQYLYVGEKPPRMLYMTDGGVKDCTAVLQLLWRRRERILLVLANADPEDELAVLKGAMAEAERLKLATFYDIREPRDHLDILFESHRSNPEWRYMHIGIRYCWPDSDGASSSLGGARQHTGVLVVVKNRLPESFRGMPVQPLLTADVIRGNGVETCAEDSQGASDAEYEFDAERWGDLTTDQLGSLGCCDCCHTRGLNCGPKFPHGMHTGYLWLTPQWCNHLARLGRAMSEGAAEELERH